MIVNSKEKVNRVCGSYNVVCKQHAYTELRTGYMHEGDKYKEEKKVV